MEIQPTPCGILKTALHYWLLCIRILLDIISDTLFGLYYNFFHPRQRLPPLRSTMLLESATFLAKKIRSRELRSVDVVEEFITRITDINPVINAVVSERFALARKEAAEVDRILDGGRNGEIPLGEEYSEERKPFFGVPFTNKEAIRVAGQPNTSGLYLRSGFLAKEDADCVKRMRQAGESFTVIAFGWLHLGWSIDWPTGRWCFHWSVDWLIDYIITNAYSLIYSFDRSIDWLIDWVSFCVCVGCSIVWLVDKVSEITFVSSVDWLAHAFSSLFVQELFPWRWLMSVRSACGGNRATNSTAKPETRMTRRKSSAAHRAAKQVTFLASLLVQRRILIDWWIACLFDWLVCYLYCNTSFASIDWLIDLFHVEVLLFWIAVVEEFIHHFLC